MKFGKKQLILTGLVLTLGTAVYLNWQFSNNTDLLTGADAVSVSKELGQAEFVNTSSDKKVSELSTEKSKDKSTSTSTPKITPTENTTQSTDKVKSDEYFAQAKVDRQQTQDKIAEMTQKILESAEESDTAKAEAVAQASQLATIIEQQTNVESLIKSKGFNECLVFIQNGECSIVVDGTDLTSDEAMIIKDVAEGQTGITSDKIKITSV